MRHLHIKFAIVLLALVPIVSFALPDDREQPINIEADHAQLDDKEGVTQYKGNAILTQGTLKITGDIITFYYDADKQITKAVAQGNLATYRQIQKPGEEPVRARALQMEYYAKSQKIYLLGKGHVWQAGDEFSGNKIEYDIEKNIVNASSAPITVGNEPQKAERIHIIIQPPGAKTKTPAKPKKAEPAATSAIETSESNSTKTNSYPTGTTISRLNIRTGPGTQYDKIGTFDANAPLTILTEQREWIQVRGMIGEQAIIGWVNRRYILQAD
ncbi:MAG: lipopolysaccharide transport periplasmic protein LptA [Gammaproteobacteria bacterium]|nr:lipopolysaccharide transport periplasmic protein LptA [Gammaproteobacteria bacterium]MBW6454111.1 lipopolysaccharide transport periplasmic protein LptA [Methyloprofundus sp.]